MLEGDEGRAHLSSDEHYVSVQSLAEMYPNLTGPRMRRPDAPAAVRAKILAIASLPTLQVLPLTGDVQIIVHELCEKCGITSTVDTLSGSVVPVPKLPGKQYVSGVTGEAP